MIAVSPLSLRMSMLLRMPTEGFFVQIPDAPVAQLYIKDFEMLQ